MIVSPTTYLKERKRACRNACLSITLCSCQVLHILRPRGRKGGHCCGFMSLLLPLSCPACSIPVTCHPSVCGFALLSQAPAPEARSEDVLHGLAASEALTLCSCVHAVPFLGGMWFVSVIFTYLSSSLNLEKVKVVGFQMCCGFTTY